MSNYVSSKITLSVASVYLLFCGHKQTCDTQLQVYVLCLQAKFYNLYAMMQNQIYEKWSKQQINAYN